MNRPDQSDDKQGVEKEILQYLVAHPYAQDTVNGIVRWWFLTEPVKKERDVQEALDKLVAADFVIAEKGSDSQIRYKLNHQELEKIRLWLKQRS